MQARFPPLELPRSGSQGSAVILTALSARLLRAPLRALTIQLLSRDSSHTKQRMSTIDI